MGKLNKNSRINAGFVQDYVATYTDFLSQPLKESSNVIFNSGTFTEDVTINRNLTVLGNTVVIGTETLQVQDNLITLNNGELGAGVSAVIAGIEIDRGTLPNYQFVFSEIFGNFRMGQENETYPISIREENPMDGGILLWDDVGMKMVSTKTIREDITFTGSIITTSLNISGDAQIGGSFILENINGRLEIITENPDIIRFISSQNIHFNVNSLNIPDLVKLNFGSETSNIVYDNILNKLTIESADNINLSSITTKITSNLNTLNSSTGSFLVSGSLGLAGNLNIGAGTQDYNIFGNTQNLYIKNNNATQSLNLVIQPLAASNTVNNKINIKTSNSDFFIGYDFITNKHILNNSKTIPININNSQLEFMIDGSLYSNNSLLVDGIISLNNTTNSTSLSTGSIHTVGGVGITKDLRVGGKQYIFDTSASSSLITGALQVSGGISAAENSYFEKKIIIKNYNFEPSASNLTLTQPNNSTFLIKPNTDGADIGFSLEPSSLIYLDLTYSSSATEFNIYSSNTINLGRNKQLELKTDGTIFLDNTLSSSSLTSAALVVSGGITIKKTTLATSATSGGALTVAGGVAIGGNLIVGGAVFYSGSLEIVGSLIVAGTSFFNSDTSIDVSTNIYTFSGRTVQDTEMLLKSSGIFNNGYMSSLSNGTQNVLSRWYSSGGSSVSTYSRLNIGYNTSSYIISTEQEGGSALYDIIIETSGNSEQIKLSTNGQVYFNKNIDSTSTSGTIVSLGGITSKSTVDSVDLNNGGSMTLMGGASISKKLKIGSDLTLLNTISIFEIKGTTIPRLIIDTSGTRISPNGITNILNITQSSTSISNLCILTNTTNTTGSGTGTLQVAGGAYIEKDFIVNENLYLNSSSQIHVFKNSSVNLASLVLQSQTINNLIFNSATNNYLNDITTTYEAGYISNSNFSRMNVGWNSSSNKYSMSHTYSGGSNNYDLVLENGTTNQLIISSDGTSTFSNTTSSTSLSSGSVKFLGGLSISKTTNSSSITNGGSITTAGGIAIAKDTYIGGIVRILDSTATTSYQTGALSVSGGISGTGLSVGTSISSSYLFNSLLNSFVFKSTSLTENTSFDFQGSNSLNVNLSVIGASGSNKESLDIKWDQTKYNINTFSSGSGVLRNLLIKAGTSEILMNTNGTISLSSTTSSSSSGVGSFVLSGGLSISNTTNSSSLTNGGSFTTAGGIAIAKDVYVGGNITQLSSIPLTTINKAGTSASIVNKDSAGLELMATEMSEFEYTPALKFMSNSSNFSSKKILACISGVAAENYSSATSSGMSLEFMTTPANIGISSTPSTRMSIGSDGVVIITNNNPSSTSNAALFLYGGMTILKNTNSISTTSGGSLTLLGGFAVAKDVYIGGKTFISDTTDNSGVNTGSLQTSGGLYVAKKSYFDGSITLSSSSQNYIFSTRTIPDTSMVLQSLSSGSSFNLDLYTLDQDGTDDIKIKMYGSGGDNTLNYDNLELGYNSSDTSYRIKTVALGTGIIRKLVLGTPSHTDQLSLNTDGTITLSSTVVSDSSTNGAFKLSGGIAISLITNSVSKLNGGALTVSGGGAFNKDLYIGGQLNVVSITNSTSTSTGSAVFGGGIGISGNLFSTGKFVSSYIGSDAINISSVFILNTSTLSITSTASLSISNTANSVSTASGSINTAGGLGVAKNIVIGESFFMTGTGKTFDFNNNIITNVPTPSSGSDAVNKLYVDNRVLGINIKQPVRVATTSSKILATDFQTGDTIDGIVLATGDRVLVKDQTNGIENGIYIVTTGAPTRSSDFAAGSSSAGSNVRIYEGTVNNNTNWEVTNENPNDVVGTNSIIFLQYYTSGIGPGIGLIRSGSFLDVVVDNTSIQVFNNALRISSGAAGTGLLGGSGSPLSTSSNQSHITSVGTLTIGIWTATAITVPYGGTGLTSLSSGRIPFGAGTSPLASSSLFIYDTTKNSLSINTSIPDPANSSDGLTLLDRDIGIKSSASATRGQYFQESDNQYSWGISRTFGLDTNKNLLFQTSGSATLTKTNLNATTPVLALKSNNRVGINTLEQNITKNLFVTGTAEVTGDLTVGTFNSGSVGHTLTFADLVNSSAPTVVNSRLTKNGTYHTLTFVLSCLPTSTNINTSFSITLPSRVDNFSLSSDMAICSVSGFNDTTNYNVLQNILGYSLNASTKVIVKFQAVSTSITYVQGIIYYHVL